MNLMTTEQHIKNSKYYEISAGYDMAIPISMSVLGFKELVCVDIRKLMLAELLNDTTYKLKRANDVEIRLSEFQKNLVFTKHNAIKLLEEL